MTPTPTERASPPPAFSDPVVQLCAFKVGDEEYALDIMRVREIIPPSRITPVPRAPEFVEGVVNLRGTILPVMDLRKRLCVPARPLAQKSKYLVCSVGPRRVALVVDAVTEVLRIPRSALKRAPALLSRPGPRFFLGVCGPDERLKLLLNLKALLESAGPVPGPEDRAAARDAGLLADR